MVFRRKWRVSHIPSQVGLEEQQLEQRAGGGLGGLRQRDFNPRSLAGQPVPLMAVPNGKVETKPAGDLPVCREKLMLIPCQPEPTIC